jgi:hypothetical protein
MAFITTDLNGKEIPLAPGEVQYTDAIPSPNRPKGPSNAPIALTKMQAWSYEKEWRFLQKDELCVNAGKTDILGNEILLCDFDLASIREVIFGYFCSQEIRARIKGALLARGLNPLCYELLKRSDAYGFERRNVALDDIPDEVPESALPVADVGLSAEALR